MKSSNIQKRNKYLRELVLGAQDAYVDSPVTVIAKKNAAMPARDQIARHKSMSGIIKRSQMSRNLKNGSATDNIRPFHSTQRCYYLQSAANRTGNIYVRTGAYPRKEREGGMTGEEEYEEALRMETEDLERGTNTRYKSNRSSFAGKSQMEEDMQNPKCEEKMLDRRKSKLDASADVFGKPHVIIRNHPGFLGPTLTGSSQDVRSGTNMTTKNGDAQRIMDNLDMNSTAFNRTRFSE